MSSKPGKTSEEIVDSSTEQKTTNPNQSVKQLLSTAYNGVKEGLKLLGKIPDVPAAGIIKAVAELVLAVIEIAENISENDEDVRKLHNRLKWLGNVVLESLQAAKEAFGGLLDDLVKRLQGLSEELQSLKAKLEPLKRKYTISKVLNNSADKQALRGCNNDLDRIIGGATLEAVIATAKDIGVLQLQLSCVSEQIVETIIWGLPRAKAQYNSVLRKGQGARPCLQNTRVDILDTIYSWIDGTGSLKVPIFWLAGEPGTGKSTIAHTVAENRDKLERCQLGASFFFSRNEETRRDAKLLISTLAYQLSAFDKGFKRLLAATLENDITLPDQEIKTQLKEMVMEPLRKARIASDGPIVIIIDALDECSPDADAVEILEAFAELIQDFPLPLRVLITSRPEHHIQTKFSSTSLPSTIFHLHDISQTIVKSDIERYLRVSLDETLEGGLADDDLEHLSQRIGLLFILAATYVKYIKDSFRKDPPGQLRALLSRRQTSGRSPEGELNALYMDILEDMLKDDPHANPKVMIHDFQEVIRAVIVAGTPVTPIQLANLLRMDQVDVLAVLRRLSSVIYLPDDNAPASFFHQSFSEFLTDPNRCTNPDFQMRKFQAHLHMAFKCLDAFDEHWKKDPEPTALHKDQEIPTSASVSDSLSFSDYLSTSDDESTSDYISAFEDPQPDEPLYFPDAEEIPIQDSEIPEAISLATSQAYPEYLCYACIYFAYHLQGISQGRNDDDYARCLERFEAFYEQKLTGWLAVIKSLHDLPAFSDLPARLHSGYIEYYQSHEKRSQTVLDQMVSFQRTLLPDPQQQSTDAPEVDAKTQRPAGGETFRQAVNAPMYRGGGMFRSRPPHHKFLDLIFYQEGKWPNWDPERKVTLGDYGMVERETGLFMPAGSIYDQDIRAIVPEIGEYEPVRGKSADYHEIAVHAIKSAQGGAAPLANASFEGSWSFNRKQGALFIMHNSTFTHLPRTRSNKILQGLTGVPGLKGMGIVTAVWSCSGYVRYLSTKGSDNISVKLVADVPVSQATMASVGGGVTGRWECETGAGIFKKADPRGEQIYSGMFVLKEIKKEMRKHYR